MCGGVLFASGVCAASEDTAAMLVAALRRGAGRRRRVYRQPIVITIKFFASHRFVWHPSVSKVATIVPFFGLNLFSGVLVQPLVIEGVLAAIGGWGRFAAHGDIANLLAKCIAVGVGMLINFFGAKWPFKWTDDVE